MAIVLVVVYLVVNIYRSYFLKNMAKWKFDRNQEVYLAILKVDSRFNDIKNLNLLLSEIEKKMSQVSNAWGWSFASTSLVISIFLSSIFGLLENVSPILLENYISNLALDNFSEIVLSLANNMPITDFFYGLLVIFLVLVCINCTIDYLISRKLVAAKSLVIDAISFMNSKVKIDQV